MKRCGVYFFAHCFIWPIPPFGTAWAESGRGVLPALGGGVQPCSGEKRQASQACDEEEKSGAKGAGGIAIDEQEEPTGQAAGDDSQGKCHLPEGKAEYISALGGVPDG